MKVEHTINDCGKEQSTATVAPAAGGRGLAAETGDSTLDPMALPKRADGDCALLERAQRLLDRSLNDGAPDLAESRDPGLDGEPAFNRVLIVDDDASLRRLIRCVLTNEYLLEEADSGEAAIEKMGTFAPGLVLLDISMDGIDGYETCRRIKSVFEANCTQVVMVSARSSTHERMRAFSAGADDYVVKPFDPQDLRSRVRLHFQLREAMTKAFAIRHEIDKRDYDLRRLVEKRAEEIIATQDVAVFTLARLAESRDNETGGHLARMRSYSQSLAIDLSCHGPYAEQIDRQFLEDLYRSSVLHDIGKVGIPDEILRKPGRLTSSEFATMQQHSVIGGNILDEAVRMSSGGGFLAMAATIARHHHERFDGTGYPDGLKGLEIPLAARIVSVADVFDAITSQRPYKPAISAELAKEMIEAESGRHFDPVVVAAFVRRFPEFLRGNRDAESAGDLAQPGCSAVDC